MHDIMYYMTLAGPCRGERVVAAIFTSDRAYAESVLGCGKIDDSGFSFRGLYTEEEAGHMFCPGTDIIGTCSPSTGMCEKHRDMSVAPKFMVNHGTAFRMDNPDIQLDLTDSSFLHIKSELFSRRIKPKSAKQQCHAIVPDNAASQEVCSEDENLSSETFPKEDDSTSAGLFDCDASEPEFSDDDLSSGSGVLPDVYDGIKPVKSVPKDKTEYISVFDSTFYNAQKAVVSDPDFESDDTLRDRFGLSAGQPVKRQGQSLKELISSGSSGIKFTVE